MATTQRKALIDGIEVLLEPSITHKSVVVDGKTYYLNSPIVTVLRWVTYCKGKLYFAAMKYGDKYMGRSSYGKYGFPTGHLNLNEGLCGTMKRGEKTYGGCVEREALEKLNYDLYSIDQKMTVHHNDLKSITRWSREPEDDQYVTLSFTLLTACAELPPLGKRNEFGEPIPYGETDSQGRHEVERADWIPVDDMFTNKTPLAYGQNRLAADMFKYEVLPLLYMHPAIHPEIYDVYKSYIKLAEIYSSKRRQWSIWV